MKKYLFFLKKAILFCIVFLSIVVLYYFYYYNQHFESDSFELKINWMFTISYFIIFFYVLLFLIDLKNYNLIFFTIIIIGTPLWIIIYFLEYFKIEPSFWNWYTIRDISAILCISILSHGLTLNFIKYIKNNSNHNETRGIFQKYHIHEGFVGIIFTLIACFLWIMRFIMIQHEILKNELRIYLAIEMILLFLFLFSGSFLIFRDWRDIISLKFVEKRNYNHNNKSSIVFNPITPESIKFFKSPKILLYPFGMLLSSLSLNLFVHGIDFLPEEVFNINHEILILISIFLCFIAGGMLGMDWYRLFARLYPNLYREFENILKDFKK